MKKYILMVVICISSFMIYTNNVKAYTYNVNLTGLNNASITSGQHIDYHTWTNFSPFTFYGWQTVFNTELNAISKGSFNMVYSTFSGNYGTYNLTFMLFSDFGTDGYNESVDEFTISVNNTACSIINNSKFSNTAGIMTISCNEIDFQGTLNVKFVTRQSYSFGVSTPILSNSTDNKMIEDNLVNITNALTSMGNSINSVNSNISNTNTILNNIYSSLTTIINSTNSIQTSTETIKNDIKDSSIDNSNTSSSTSTWSSKNATNGTITNLLTLPISLLQNIVNGIQTSCSNFSLGILFNTELILPCIDLSDFIGSTLFNVIDLLFSGFMILNISKKLIKIFNDFTNLKSNQIDEIYSNGGGSS